MPDLTKEGGTFVFDCFSDWLPCFNLFFGEDARGAGVAEASGANDCACLVVLIV